MKKYSRRRFGPKSRYEAQEEGIWAAQGFVDIYTGDPVHWRDTDVDHVIPLAWAWRNGASKWNRWKRKRFGKDGLNLAVTLANVNRAKGDKGIDEWQPPVNKENYHRRWQELCGKYGLPMP